MPAAAPGDTGSVLAHVVLVLVVVVEAGCTQALTEPTVVLDGPLAPPSAANVLAIGIV